MFRHVPHGLRANADAARAPRASPLSFNKIRPYWACLPFSWSMCAGFKHRAAFLTAAGANVKSNPFNPGKSPECFGCHRLGAEFLEYGFPPAWPRARARSGFSSNGSRASARARGSPGSHKTPPPVASTNSGNAPERGCTTGTPAASASIT